MRKLLFVLSVVSIFMYSCTSGEANNQEKTSPETTIAPGEVEFKTTDNGNATSDFPEIKFETAEKCYTCNGTGKVGATILVLEQIERDLNYIAQTQMKSPIRLEVHPFVESYLKKGYLKSVRRQWQKKYNKKISVIENNNFQFTFTVDEYPDEDEIVIVGYLYRKRILCDESYSLGYKFNKENLKSYLSQKALWDFGY